MDNFSRIKWAQRLLALASLIIGVYVFAATLAMVIHCWSPVPVSDQWDEIVSGRQITWSWLFSQHNEHRIVFPRLVFVMDRYWFAETHILDYGVNVLLQSAMAFLMFRLAVRSGIENRWGVVWIGGFCLALLFWSIQNENFTSGFQVPNFGVLLAAASAFTVVAAGAHERRALILAITLEVIAVYTLASGIIVPFLNVVIAIWIGRSRTMIAILTLVALTLLSAYLAGYQAPSGLTNPLESFSHPGSVVAYSLVELGMPLYHTVGHFFLAQRTLISELAGSLGVLLFSMFVWLAFRRRREPAPHRLALLAVATFVVAMTLLTSAGRLGHGLNSALTSRYATPVVTFWLSLAALGMAHFGVTVKRQALVMLACLPLQMLIFASERQFTVFAVRFADVRTLSIPFLLADVADEEMLKGALYPSTDRLLMIAKGLRAAHTSIFRDPWVDWMGTPLAEHLTVVGRSYCHGSFERVERVVDARPPGWRASGSASFADETKPARRILFTDTEGNIVGYGVGGFDLNQLVDANHLFFNEFPPGQGKQQWVGAFSSSAPETVVAYALAGDAPTACRLGTVRSSPSTAATMLNTR
jgi:hypothetical protein